VTLSGTGMASMVQSTALVAGTQEAVSGAWVGGSAEVELGPIALLFHTMAGSMTQTGNTTAISRDGGEISGGVRLSPVPWIGIQGGYTIRTFSSVVGYQDWKLAGGGLVLSPTLGNPAIRAHLMGLFLPSVSVAGRDSPELGVAAEAGVRFAPLRIPIVVSVAYRFERYDFPEAATVRVEQFDQLMVRLGVRWGIGRR